MHAPPPHPTPSPAPFVAAAPARDLFSTHARRLVQTYLRLRLLELRESDLDRVRAVVEGKLPVDALFPPGSPGKTNR
jgi:hypothetical protein